MPQCKYYTLPPWEGWEVYIPTLLQDPQVKEAAETETNIVIFRLFLIGRHTVGTILTCVSVGGNDSFGCSGSELL